MCNSEQKKLQIWWMGFMTYVGVCRFSKSLKLGGKTEILVMDNAAPFDETTYAGKLMVAAMTRNAVVMVHLTMTFTVDRMMVLVYETMYVDDWPGGFVHKVVDILKEAKYMPQDTMMQV